MRSIGSIVVCSLAWLAVILTGLATAVFAPSLVSGTIDAWGPFVFMVGVALPLGGGTLFLAFGPSLALYAKTKERRDLMSVIASGTAIAVLLIETVWINGIPRRGE